MSIPTPTKISSSVMKNGSLSTTSPGPVIVEDVNKISRIVDEAKKRYFASFKESKDYFKNHEMFCALAQKYVLERVIGCGEDLNFAIAALSELTKATDRFQRLLKVPAKSPVEEKAKRQYFNVMKPMLFDDNIGLDKIKRCHHNELHKACKFILEECDDIDEATKYIEDLNETSNTFLNVLDYA